MKIFFSSSPLWQQQGIALVRIITGALLIYHGWEVFDEMKMNEYLKWEMFKNSSGKLMVYAGKWAELIAGVLLFVGLFTRLAAILVIGTLGYIVFFVGNGRFWYEEQHPFLFVLLGLVFFFTGPGNLSLDKAIFKK